MYTVINLNAGKLYYKRVRQFLRLLVVNRRQVRFKGLQNKAGKHKENWFTILWGPILRLTVTQTGSSTYLYGFTAKQSRSSNHLWPRGPDCGNSLCHVRRKREVNAPVIPSASYHGHIIIKGCDKHLPKCMVFGGGQVHPELSHVTRPQITHVSKRLSQFQEQLSMANIRFEQYSCLFLILKSYFRWSFLNTMTVNDNMWLLWLYSSWDCFMHKRKATLGKWRPVVNNTSCHTHAHTHALSRIHETGKIVP